MKHTALPALLAGVACLVLAPASVPATAAPGAMPAGRTAANGGRRSNADGPRANPVRVGGGFHAGSYFYPSGGFRYPSPLQRSVNPSSGCYGIYSAAVRAGGTYALNLRLPQAGPGTRIYLAGRWPLGRGADLRPLPLNTQPGAGPLARGLYRWRFGIAPGSYGSVVYVVIVAPWLCGGAPPYYGVAIDPWESRGARDYGNGAAPVMQADGPLRLDLAPAERDGNGTGANPPARMPLPGDIVGNPDFSRGLLDWQAIAGGRPATDSDFVRSTPQGIELSGTGTPVESGVRQRLEENVSKATAVILQASLKVSSPRGADGPPAPALTIEICYGDTDGDSHCGTDAFRRRFEALPPGTDTVAGVQRVPRDGWYRETFDLMRLDPRPARLDSITLLAPSEPGATAWVREVHLLVRRH